MSAATTTSIDTIVGTLREVGAQSVIVHPSGKAFVVMQYGTIPFESTEDLAEWILLNQPDDVSVRIIHENETGAAEVRTDFAQGIAGAVERRAPIRRSGAPNLEGES